MVVEMAQAGECGKTWDSRLDWYNTMDRPLIVFSALRAEPMSPFPRGIIALV